MSSTIESAPFIRRVKELIKDKRWNHAELADKSGISKSQLSRLLAGKNKRIQQATVDKIIAAFGLTKKQFFVQTATLADLDQPTHKKAKMVYSDRLPTVVGEFVGRIAELAVLNQALHNHDVNILQFIAPGGTGKTKLLRHWLNSAREELPSMIAWSFYSQGASSDKQLSTSPFFNHAFDVLSSEKRTFNSDEDKGDYLASLLREQQCVLILDGLEPLQYADPANRGELKDRALSRLLKNLAGKTGTFCVITSRIAIYELSDRSSVLVHNLQNLDPTDSLALLTSLGVTGPTESIQQAVTNYAGHALALSLLGNLLRLRYRGDINKRETLPTLMLDGVDKTSRHAFKIMQAYQDWFVDTPELCLLYLLGLFDHPVEIEVLESLWEANIPGLTDGMSEADWYPAIESLRHNHRLLTDGNYSGEVDGVSQVLDCHPLIREYFGQQLAKNSPDAWQQAHQHLYEYYKAIPDKDQPDTLEDMRPLFHAVRHGCTAGLYNKTFDEVYWKRICRESEWYLRKRLAGFSDDLAIITHFFSKPWDTFKENIEGENQNVLMISVVNSLQALGRIKEANKPSQRVLQTIAQSESWMLAISYVFYLCQMQLKLGDLSGAVKTAQLGIDYADKSDNAFEMSRARALYASVMHQLGERDQSLALYKESEKMYRVEKVDVSYLYSAWGYCDLLLELGEIDSFIDKVEGTLKWLEKEATPHLIYALESLNFAKGRVNMKNMVAAGKQIELSIEALRKSGRKDMLPLGLLTRAAISREIGSFTKAYQDLQEIYDIAEPSGMRLYLTDYHLEMARVLLKQWQQQLIGDTAHSAIQKHIASAVKLIDETGYHRRDTEVEALIGPTAHALDKQKKWSEEW